MRWPWTKLLVPACAIGFSQSVDAAHNIHCDAAHIQAEIAATGRIPSLIGCRPEAVRPALSSADYGLTIDNQVPSETFKAGLIVAQHNPSESGTVHVDVSTGPGYNPQQQEQGGFDQEVGGQIIRGILGVIAGAAQRPPPPPYVPPVQTVEPAQPQQPLPPPVAVEPAPLPPVTPVPDTTAKTSGTDQAPKTAAPPPQPPPPPKAPIKTEVAQTGKSTAQVADAPKDASTPPAKDAGKPNTKSASQVPPPPPPPPPPTRFSIAGDRHMSVEEGGELYIVVRRTNPDGNPHLIQLQYNPASLLSNPVGSFDFGSDLADAVRVKIGTARRHLGSANRDLSVTLVSAKNAMIDRPDSVLAVILDSSSRWVRFLRWLASHALLALAAAGAAAVAAGAGVLKLLMPRATCSIGSPRIDLGPMPFRRSWPAFRVSALIGEPAFSIPRPLPLERLGHAKLNPA